MYEAIIRSIYEFSIVRHNDIRIDHSGMDFTDDSVLTVAMMDTILPPEIGYAKM